MRKISVTSLTIIFLLLSGIGWVLSAPSIPITFTVEGDIEKVSWHPRELLRKGIPGMSGTLGIDFYSTAQYQVVLANTIFKAEDEVSRAVIEEYKAIKEQPLFLDHEKDDGFLKKGMRIQVLEYQIMGDEGGNWYDYKKILILPTTDEKKTEEGDLQSKSERQSEEGLEKEKDSQEKTED